MTRTTYFLIFVCLIIGACCLPLYEAAPDITAYNNSVSDTGLYPHQQVNTNIQFNVTVNESVNYSWYRDGVSISNNFDNYTTQWSTPGQKNISTIASNPNGSTELLSWYPIVEQPMAGAGDVITELNMTAYDSILDVFGSEDPDYENFLFALTMPHTSIIGSLFYVLLYGVPFIFIWIAQGSAKIPAILGCMLAPLMLGAFNADYVPIAILFILLTLFGTVYTLYKERGS